MQQIGNRFQLSTVFEWTLMDNVFKDEMKTMKNNILILKNEKTLP